MLLGGVCDALDGQVARATNAGTQFGEELDSLVDAITFGLAPGDDHVLRGAQPRQLGLDLGLPLLRLRRHAPRAVQHRAGGHGEDVLPGPSQPRRGHHPRLVLLVQPVVALQLRRDRDSRGTCCCASSWRRCVPDDQQRPYPVFPRTGFRSLRAIGATLLLVGSIALLATKRLEFFFPARARATSRGVRSAGSSRGSSSAGSPRFRTISPRARTTRTRRRTPSDRWTRRCTRRGSRARAAPSRTSSASARRRERPERSERQRRSETMPRSRAAGASAPSARARGVAARRPSAATGDRQRRATTAHGDAERGARREDARSATSERSAASATRPAAARRRHRLETAPRAASAPSPWARRPTSRSARPCSMRTWRSRWSELSRRAEPVRGRGGRRRPASGSAAAARRAQRDRPAARTRRRTRCERRDPMRDADEPTTTSRRLAVRRSLEARRPDAALRARARARPPIATPSRTRSAASRRRRDTTHRQQRMSRYRVAVQVVPRRGLLDPQGKAVADALHTLGFGGVAAVHVGRHLVARRRRRGRGHGAAADARDVRAAARQSGHRRLRDRRGRRRHEVRHRHLPRLQLRLRRLPGRRRRRWARRPSTSGTRITISRAATSSILPGGFSYGDYLRAGAIARFSPIMQEVVQHARARRARDRHLQRIPDRVRGGPAARRAAAQRVAQVRLRADRPSRRERPTRCSRRATSAGSASSLPIAHGDGRYSADEETLDRLEGEGQVVFRYAPQRARGGGSVQPEWLDARHRGYRE